MLAKGLVSEHQVVEHKAGVVGKQAVDIDELPAPWPDVFEELVAEEAGHALQRVFQVGQRRVDARVAEGIAAPAVAALLGYDVQERLWRSVLRFLRGWVGFTWADTPGTSV